MKGLGSRKKGLSSRKHRWFFISSTTTWLSKWFHIFHRIHPSGLWLGDKVETNSEEVLTSTNFYSDKHMNIPIVTRCHPYLVISLSSRYWTFNLTFTSARFSYFLGVNGLRMCTWISEEISLPSISDMRKTSFGIVLMGLIGYLGFSMYMLKVLSHFLNINDMQFRLRFSPGFASARNKAFTLFEFKLSRSLRSNLMHILWNQNNKKLWTKKKIPWTLIIKRKHLTECNVIWNSVQIRRKYFHYFSLTEMVW